MAIRLVLNPEHPACRVLYLQCHVKPGAAKVREGILAVTDRVVDVAVAGHARGGETNNALRDVTSHALRQPKSNIEIIRGYKSRDKTIAVRGMGQSQDPEEVVANVRQRLLNSI
jgi:uncharacterized protein YggU (UPF0235/DUF167 family)